jgi:hypothetical protein
MAKWLQTNPKLLAPARVVDGLGLFRMVKALIKPITLLLALEFAMEFHQK